MLVFFFLIAVCSASAKYLNDSFEVLLVHAVVNEGQRTPDLATLYPNDMNKNVTYYPYGLGELTNEGKRTEFRIGQALRGRYDEWLDDTYTPDILYALSSNMNRTKMSLQLVLAGLFPPVRNQQWLVDINWQPIPINTIEAEFGITCPSFNRYYKELESAQEVQGLYRRYGDIIRLLEEGSGAKIEDFRDIYNIYWTLKNEEELGLSVPNWAKKIYYNQLQDMAIASLHLRTGSTDLKKLSAGFILKKIVTDSNNKLTNSLIPDTRKMFLYSGRELNLAGIMTTLDVFNDRIPPYGAYLLFELVKIKHQIGIMIYYQDYLEGEPRLLKLPTCEEFCVWEKFLAIAEEFLPQDEFCEHKCFP